MLRFAGDEDHGAGESIESGAIPSYGSFSCLERSKPMAYRTELDEAERIVKEMELK